MKEVSVKDIDGTELQVGDLVVQVVKPHPDVAEYDTGALQVKIYEVDPLCFYGMPERGYSPDRFRKVKSEPTLCELVKENLDKIREETIEHTLTEEKPIMDNAVHINGMDSYQFKDIRVGHLFINLTSKRLSVKITDTSARYFNTDGGVSNHLVEWFPNLDQPCKPVKDFSISVNV